MLWFLILPCDIITCKINQLTLLEIDTAMQYSMDRSCITLDSPSRCSVLLQLYSVLLKLYSVLLQLYRVLLYTWCTSIPFVLSLITVVVHIYFMYFTELHNSTLMFTAHLLSYSIYIHCKLPSKGDPLWYLGLPVISSFIFLG